MKSAKKVKNPDFPNDASMVLYRVLERLVDGHEKIDEHDQGFRAEGDAPQDGTVGEALKEKQALRGK